VAGGQPQVDGLPQPRPGCLLDIPTFTHTQLNSETIQVYHTFWLFTPHTWCSLITHVYIVPVPYTHPGGRSTFTVVSHTVVVRSTLHTHLLRYRSLYLQFDLYHCPGRCHIGGSYHALVVLPYTQFLHTFFLGPHDATRTLLPPICSHRTLPDWIHTDIYICDFTDLLHSSRFTVITLNSYPLDLHNTRGPRSVPWTTPHTRLSTGCDYYRRCWLDFTHTFPTRPQIYLILIPLH